ncbi:hypothetical protein GCM10009868_15630 [Terrabacter aerolatus]|uniref:Uncharacterized protein n=2 Tax=Terrabacter aerolatus TaxID=422442 RepID=A0A512D3T9_9MICO|nr:hypothetical protein TAE01_29450 [Terrabacter aerolatus]
MTLTRMGRLRAVLAAYSFNPYLRGRAAELAGGALLADGLGGRRSPLDGRKSRSGILGGVLIVVVGLLAAWSIASHMSSLEAYPDGQTVPGTVVAVHYSQTSRCTSTQAVCTVCTVEAKFTSGGLTTTALAGVRSPDQCTMKGQPVDVSVRGSDLGSARVLLPTDQTLFTVGLYFAWLWVALGVWVLLDRLAAIVVGTVLLRQGRRLVATHPAVPVDELMSDLQDAWGPGAARTTAYDAP